ncbi:MAG: DUF4116 domain-containing protein [Clostridia bacterium]|nr:DUF4116 domain-containing protein [Clostridia bacterium]
MSDLDEEYIIKAVENKEYTILSSMDDNFKKDKNLFFKILTIDPMVLQYADESLKKDREIVLKAIEGNPMALRYADEIIQDNSDIVLTAVKSDPMALQYASKRIRGYSNKPEDIDNKNDIDILVIAVKSNPIVRRFISRELREEVIKRIRSNVKEQSSEKDIDKDPTISVSDSKTNDSDNKTAEVVDISSMTAEELEAYEERLDNDIKRKMAIQERIRRKLEILADLRVQKEDLLSEKSMQRPSGCMLDKEDQTQ